MLHIDPNELANRFRQPGGSDWVEFVDNVLWAACWQIGIPESAVRTCLRTDFADGGVDTRISEGSALDMTGYLGSPSIWQFKGGAEANLRISEIAKEVNKSHAKERILAGAAYRLCLCVQFADEKRTEWETALESAVAGIYGAAPTPKILTVDDVARMAGHFPNFIHEFSGPEIQSTTSTFATWGKSAEARTRKFVPGASFHDLKERIRLHVDLATAPADPVLRVRGLAGTGKTRSVYEALKTLHASHGLTTYAQNGQDALKAIRILANTPRMGGILVADDGSLQTREEIAQAAAGHQDRVRVIVIQDDLEEDITPESELRTPRYTHQEVANLLAANFGEVSPERLRAYVTLTDGYLRFAIDLCACDHEIQKTQGMVPTMPTIMTFYRNRLGSDTAYLDALGLFTRVGREGDVSGELDALCRWRGFRRSGLEERCAELRDSPGFVERSAIYYRVSPDIIANQAFAGAWKRWANGREHTFLTEIQALPQAMQKSFMTRVARSATTGEVRNAVRDFFQSFASKLTSADLSDIKKILQLITLTEVEPDHYFPILRRLVESASDKQLSVDRPVALGWGPRRQLVFAAERMAHFSSFFDDAERILFRLSQVEIEPNIGNNASGVWNRLFRPKLSGTPIPFASRAALLRRRLPRLEEPLPKAIQDALEKTFDYIGSGRMSAPVVAGRIPEPQWTIRSQAEQIECVNLCLALLFEVAQSRSRSADSNRTYRLLIDATDMFVRQGFLEEVEGIVHMEMLPDHVQASLYSRLTKYGTRSGLYRGIPESLLSDEYAAKMAAWVVSFAPRSLLSRIVQESSSSFFGADDEQQWLQRLSPIANEFLTLYPSNSGEFRESADWLHAAGAHGAFNFGFQVGRLDLSGALLNYVFERAAASEQTEFARGYLAGSHAVDALAAPELSELLNSIQLDQPKIAYSLALAVAELSDAFGRTLDMVENHLLEPSFLRDFTAWIGTRKASLDDVQRALKILMPRVALQERGCADIALDFVAYQYYRSGDPDWEVPQDDGFHMLSWEVVDAVTHDENLHSYWWGQVVLALQKTSDPLRIAKLLVKTMCCENFHLRQEADRMLGSFAESHPQAVMDALGEMMLDEEMQVHFHVERFSTFLALPTEVVDRWLDANGIEGALRVAHHIPGPYLDDDKVAMLHPLTRTFLERHAQDDRVFHEFAGSLHSLQSYKGDIAALKDEEAELARKFLRDDCQRVRDWAAYEIERSTKQAAEFRAMIDKHRD